MNFIRFTVINTNVKLNNGIIFYNNNKFFIPILIILSNHQLLINNKFIFMIHIIKLYYIL